MQLLLNTMRSVDARLADPDFYILFETHVNHLRKLTTSQYVTVEGQQGQKYRGDFYGLLDTLAIEKIYHYLILRLNNLLSSSDYDGTLLTILVPQPREMARFMTIYSSKES